MFSTASLELAYPDEGTREWQPDAATCRLSISTGKITRSVTSVPAAPTGFLVRSGVYDVTRFVWGTRNMWAVLVSMDGDHLYYSQADEDLMNRCLEVTCDGTPIFGADLSYTALIPHEA